MRLRQTLFGLGVAGSAIISHAVQAEGLHSRVFLGVQNFHHSTSDQVYQNLDYLGAEEVSYEEIKSLFATVGLDVSYQADGFRWFIGAEESAFDVYYHTNGGPQAGQRQLAPFYVTNIFLGVGYQRPIFNDGYQLGFAVQSNNPAIDEGYELFDAELSSYVSFSISLGPVKKTSDGNFSAYLAATQGKRLAGGDFPLVDGVEIGAEFPW